MSNPSWIGRKLSDRYEVEDLLGAGGMSSVFRANDPNLRRTVAIKLIHPHLSSDPQFVSRFEEEAVSVAQLRHPNIIQVHDFSHDADTYYMVLEFVPGETLEDNMKRMNESGRRLATNDAVEIIASICDALEYAHNRGMVHRDIKPANIMVNLQGQAILMDFGIAKIVGGKQHTATGAVVGTAYYMAPEVIKGEVADQRADIYSLGVTLFEALTGTRPFEANSAMSILMMHINDPVPNASQLNPEVSPAVVAAVVTAMAKEKGDRYQTAAEFATALRSAVLGETAPVAPAGLAGTMIEDAPVEAAPPLAGTMVEDVPVEQEAPLAGTMVEAAPQVASPGAAGTMIETAPAAAGIAGTMIETAPVPTAAPPEYAIPSSSASPSAPPQKKTTGLPLKWIGIGAGGLLLIIALAFFAFKGFGPADPTVATATPEPEIVAALIEPTATTIIAAEPTATLEPTATSEPTATFEPTATLPPTETPTATIPPGLQVRIQSILLDGSAYVVEYETFEYTEALPGEHVHFYWNTFTQDQVGVGGGGSWAVYGGPRPFKGFTTANRPSAATQMCAIVANSNHTIILDTGNCVDLP
jgi:hypothetical protein